MDLRSLCESLIHISVLHIVPVLASEEDEIEQLGPAPTVRCLHFMHVGLSISPAIEFAKDT